MNGYIRVEFDLSECSSRPPAYFDIEMSHDEEAHDWVIEQACEHVKQYEAYEDPNGPLYDQVGDLCREAIKDAPAALTKTLTLWAAYGEDGPLFNLRVSTRYVPYEDEDEDDEEDDE